MLLLILQQLTCTVHIKIYEHYLTSYFSRRGTILKVQIGTIMWMQREM